MRYFAPATGNGTGTGSSAPLLPLLGLYDNTRTEAYSILTSTTERFLFDVGCVTAYMMTVNLYAMLNGGALFRTQRRISHRWRLLLSVVFFPISSSVLGSTRHHVFCFLSQTFATWIILWLSCDLFEDKESKSNECK